MRPTARWSSRILGLVLLASVMATGTASAQAPANDNFADAATLSAETPVITGSTLGATGQPGEPTHGFGFDETRSVWFKYTATRSRSVTIGTCGSFSGSVARGYTGDNVDNLQPLAGGTYIACSLDGEYITFPAVAGQTYHFSIDSRFGATGSYRIELDPPPANDERANRWFLGDGYDSTGDTSRATKESDEPDHAGEAGGHSVWFGVYSDTTAPVVVQACSTDFDPVLAVYDEGNDELGDQSLTVTRDDDGAGCGPGGTSTRLRFVPPVAGSYYVALDGSAGGSGAYRIGAVTNDDHAGALGLLGWSRSSNNTYASAEPGEPAHGGAAAAHSLWYRVDLELAPGQLVAIRACSYESDFEPVLAAYTGSPQALVAVPATGEVSSECGMSGTGRSLSLEAPDGPLYIAVDGRDGGTGTFTIDARTAPPNDDQANPTDVPEYDTYLYGETSLATREPGEPDHAGDPGGHSIWYSLASASARVVILDTCYSSFDTLLAVYTEEPEGLREVASNDDASGCEAGGSRVQFSAAADTRYLIAVDGKEGAKGYSYLDVQRSPVNDDFESAWEIGPFAWMSGRTGLATAQPGEPAHAGTPATNSLWYTVSTSSTDSVGISTCSSSSAPSRIAVYEGAIVDDLSVIAEGGPTAGCASGNGARVSWRPPDAAFRTYRVAVDQAGDEAVSFQLNRQTAPSNDDRAAALWISDGGDVTNTTVFARHEADEPDHASAGGAASLWYRWQPYRGGPARVSTCTGTSSSDTILAVYRWSDSTLTEVAANDDAAGCGDGRQSRVDFEAEDRATYYIAVDARPGEEGTFRLRSVQRPVNDNRADATNVGSGSAYTNLDLATKEPAEGDHAGVAGGQSVWYRWSPGGAGPATIDACSFYGTGIDPVLAVYTEQDGVLAEVASNDDTPGCGVNGTGSRVQFTATAGTQYLVATDSKTSGEGYIYVEFPPVNDMFAGAITQGSTAFTHYGTLARATAEDGEPAHGGAPATRSVWFDWTPPRNGQATLDNCQYANTRVAAYTGTALSDLTEVAPRPGSACAAGQTGSRLRFDAVGGTTYRIAIDVVGNAMYASYGLNARLGPANDAFGDATNTGSSTTFTQHGTTVDGGLQEGEPDHAGSGGVSSVWYRWTAPHSATLHVDTCSAASFDTVIALYTQQASGVAGLQEVASNDDSAGCGGGPSSRVRVHVDSGTTYWVAVTGWGPVEGTFTLRFGLGPANDDFANASTLISSVNGNNLNAGDEPAEPDHGALGGDRSVWYRFSASDDRNVELRACPTNASPTPAAAVYTGTALGLLTPAGTGSTRTIDGVSCRIVSLRGAGGEYVAAIDGAAPGQEGRFRVTLAVAAANDDRDRAQQVSGSGTVSGTTFGATPEAGEPEHAGVAGDHSVWYRWTPAHSGPVLLETCSSELDTLLAVYVAGDAGAGALDPVASSDDATGCGTGASRVVFTAQAGTEYLVAVDSKGGSEGSFVLGFPPANDLFAAATQLSGALVSRTGTVLRAGSEPDEPEHAGTPAARSVWYAWTPPRSARVEISTCLASSAATRVGLYTGDDVDALTSVASAGPTAGCADGQGALLRTRVTGGTTYRIAVDGDPAATFTLQAALAPVNDDRADAVAVSEPRIVSGTTAFATTEDGEPERAGHAADASVWYRFEATSDGPVTLKTCSSAFATVLGVYDENIGAFHEVASSDDAPGRCANRAALTFEATAGTQYLIAVDRRSAGPSGAFELAIGSPDNDDIQDAEELSGEHASGAANTQAATTQDGEPTDLASAGRRSAWWSWTAPTSGPIEINTCGSSHQTLLAVYHGPPDALTRDAYNHYGSGCASRSRLTLDAVAGRTYLIAVSSHGGSGGATRLQIGPPSNDDFADAEPLDSPEDAARGTIAGASAQDNEPSHGDDGKRRTIWYSWNAPANGLLTLDSCGSPTPVHIEAYTGGSISSLARLAEVDSPDGCPAGALGHMRTFQVDEAATYWIALEGSDFSAGPTALRLRLNVDQDPPTTTIDDGPPALTNAEAITFAFSSDEENSTFECRFDNDEFAACESPLDRSSLEDGDHVFEVRATDEAGNTDPDPARLEFTVDRTPPGVSITHGPDEYSNGSTASFVFSSADASAAFECALDAEEFTTCNSPTTRTELDEGSHSWRVRASDPAGNTSTDTWRYNVDTVAPETTFLSVPDPTNAVAPSITFRSETGATFSCSVDDDPFAACGSPLVVPGLDEGDHRIRVVATDRAGNVEVQAAERLFEIDRTAPQTTITGQPDGPFHDGGTFQFESSEDGYFECAIDDDAYTRCSQTYALDLIGLPPGEHVFKVRSIDAAGNVDLSPATTEFVFTNAAPAGNLAVTPETGPANLNVAAQISATDADTDLLDFEIDFGDGTTQTGILPHTTPITHTYSRAGLYVVRLEVSDGYESDILTKQVTVFLPEPLRADAGDDLVAIAGEPVRMDGGQSRPLAGIERYRWDFGDGGSAGEAISDHVYAEPGSYEATLTLEAGVESDSDTARVRVLASDADLGVQVTARSNGLALPGADVLVMTAGGDRIAAVTDLFGKARLRGLADGTHKIYAYAHDPAHLPAVVETTVQDGIGEVTIDLEPGPVADVDVKAERMTLEEILDAGIDPNDPDNQHAYEFTANIEVRPVGGGGGGGTGGFGGYVGSGGFIGSGSGGWTCRRLYCKGTVGGGTVLITHQEIAPGIHGLTTLVIPFRARWLKEFFDVSMTVHNLADPEFVLENGAAMLELPAGLSLAPTARGERLTRPVADIPGGGSATTNWIVRGDVEGEYLLGANYGATLEPFGRSVSLRGLMEDPLKVWGGSALQLIVEVDDVVSDGYPFEVRVGLKNVADVPVYNAAVELLKEGRRGYIEQPRQQREFLMTEITPGDTFWAGPFILVPEATGEVDLSRSYIKKTAGDVDLTSTIVTRPRSPTIADTPRVEARGYPGTRTLVLDWEPVNGAEDYEDFQVFRTPDRETDFPIASVATRPNAVDRTRATIDDVDPSDNVFYAVSTALALPTMSHPLISGSSAANGLWPKAGIDPGRRCADRDPNVTFKFEAIDFELASWELLINNTSHGGVRPLSGLSATATESISLRDGDTEVDLVLRDVEGNTKRATANLACDYVALGDSFAAGESVDAPFDPETHDGPISSETEESRNHCHRSQKAYSRLLKNDATLLAPVGDRLRFHACSGAVIDNMRFPNPDHDNELAQISHVNAGAHLVTLSIGGNDMKFGDIVRDCTLVGGTQALDGYCRNNHAAQLEAGKQKIREELPKLLREIRSRAPRAQILVVEYPLIFPSFPIDPVDMFEGALTGSVPKAAASLLLACNSVLLDNVFPWDVIWLSQQQEQANAMIADVVAGAGAGAQHVSMGDRFDGHDSCREADPWINAGNLGHGDAVYSFHPNLLGQHAMYEAIREHLGAPEPNRSFTIGADEVVRRTARVAPDLVHPGAGPVARAVFSHWWPGSDVELKLISPSGRIIDRGGNAADVEHRHGATSESYVVEDPEPGDWTMEFKGLDVSPGGEQVNFEVGLSAEPNLPPSAAFEQSVDGREPGLTATFDASDSQDPDGRVASYEWNFGDGSYGAGKTVEHVFSEAGRYTVRLLVRDDDGAAAVHAQKEIWVRHAPVTSGDRYSVDAGSALSVPAPGVLDNDAYDAGAGVTVKLAAPAENGVLEIETNGSFTYRPNSSFRGVDTFFYRAVDSGGLESASTPVHVDVATTEPPDTSPPVFSDVPAAMNLEASGPAGAAVTYAAPTATDAVDGTRPVQCDPASGTTVAIGTSTVTCTAADEAGNVGETTFDATVRDTTGPVLSAVPSDITTRATSPAGASVTYAVPEAGDVVDGRTDVACAPPPGSVFPIGTTTVVCASEDSRGNTSSASFSVRVTAFATPPPPPPPGPTPPPPPSPQPPPSPPPPPPPPPPPAPPPPPPPPPPTLSELFPAKLQVLRAGIRGGRLNVFARITGRASGWVDISYHSSGRRTRFTAPISNGRIRVDRLLPASQRRKTTGILTMNYAGNDRVRSDEVRLRAASGKALLKRGTTRIDSDGRLRVSGTISRRAPGIVRIRLGYAAADGSVRFLESRARITNGKWSLTRTLPADAARSGGQLSIQYTGYEGRRIRGEQLAKAVAP